MFVTDYNLILKNLMALGAAIAVLNVHPVHAMDSTSHKDIHMPAAKRQQAHTDPNELYMLAATLWGEARGEGASGMRAVGHVIMNRLYNDPERFGRSLPLVVVKHGQFACWTSGPTRHLTKQHLEALDPATADGRSWAVAKQIASELLHVRAVGNAFIDTTGGALFYAEHHVQPLEGWTATRTIGKHRFYR